MRQRLIAAAVMRPFSMITVASISPCREVPQPENVPSFHLRPARGALSAAGTDVAAGDGTAAGEALGAGLGGGAGVVTTGVVDGATTAGALTPGTGSVEVGAADRAGAPAREAGLTASGSADAEVLFTVDPAKSAGVVPVVAGDALAVAGTPFTETLPVPAVRASSVRSAKEGAGGRRRLLLRTASASAAALVRVYPAP